MVITRLPKNEWTELMKHRNYVRRRNACCCVIGDEGSSGERQDYLELKLVACHDGGWDVELDTPVKEEYKEKMLRIKRRYNDDYGNECK